MANEHVKKITDLNRLSKSDFEPIITYFKNWQGKYYSGKYAILQHKEKSNDFCFIRCMTRFQAIYKRKLWQKFEHLNHIKFQHHIILEVNPHNHVNYYNLFPYMARQWARLRAWLYKTYGAFDFIKIVEMHKKHRPHYHILIVGIPYIDYKKIEELWKSGGKYNCGFSKRIPVRNNFKALWYVLKYVNKSIVGHKNFNLNDSAIFFATNKRLFSLSRNLFGRIGIKQQAQNEAKYRFLGSKSASVVNNFVTDLGLNKDDLFYRITCESIYFYIYPYLFFIDDS